MSGNSCSPRILVIRENQGEPSGRVDLGNREEMPVCAEHQGIAPANRTRAEDLCQSCQKWGIEVADGANSVRFEHADSEISAETAQQTS
jgi:hypothetical protein